MDGFQIAFVAVIAFAVVAIGLLTYGFVKACATERQRQREAYVLDTSSCIHNLTTLNSSYSSSFNSPETYYTKHCSLNSKQQFDYFNYTKTLNQVVDDHRELFESVIDQLDFNSSIEPEYFFAYTDILRRRVVPSPLPKLFKDSTDYQQLEYELFNQRILDPALDVELVIIWEYTSPQGRNHYEACHTYHTEEIVSAIASSYEQAARKESAQYQRSRMTPGLRFEILKRDGYRCCLCGRSAQDGAELEVDHKVPVAKGGKTEPDNLWTLCKDCNRGKRDKDL